MSDLQTLLIWRNHPDIRRFMFNQHEIKFEEHQAWFQRVSNDKTRCILIVEENRQPIGFVQFSQVSIGGVANWGFYSSPYSPKGTGRKLGVTALNHAFGFLGLRKVCGQAIETNIASIAFHQSLGFKKEGVIRQQQTGGSNCNNIYCFGLVSDEWNI
jgi:UDP-4-amino-4,6-dideoxy-N-acetyl-beta-L-altrosamine N-acetyltransferase